MNSESAWLNRIERLSLKTRLFSTLYLAVLVMVLVALACYVGLSRMQAHIQDLFDEDFQTLAHVKEAQVQFADLEREVRQAATAADEASRRTALQGIRASRDGLNKELAAALPGLDTPEEQARYATLRQALEAYLIKVDAVHDMLRAGTSPLAQVAALTETKGFTEALDKVDAALVALSEQTVVQAKTGIRDAQHEAGSVVWLALALAVTGTLGSVGLAYLLVRTIEGPNRRMVEVVQALADKRHEQPVPHLDYHNEVGEMARALDVLRSVAISAEDEHWVKDQLAQLLSALRTAETPDEFGRRLLSALATMLPLGHGAFYRAVDGDRLVLLSTYAMTQRKQLQTQFAAGEGLPGQCLLERTTIHLTLPSDHVRLVSGLLDVPAVHCVVLPLVMADHVLAVMELGSYQPLAGRQLTLLDEVRGSLSGTLQVLDRNQKTRELLELAQTQSDQMQRQAAQLEEQAVEMEAQQSELREAEAWYRIIIDNSWDGILIVDGKGSILMANAAAERQFAYPEGTLAGKSVDLLVPDTVRQGHAALRDRFVDAGRNRRMGEGPTLRGRRLDGSEFALRAWLTPLPARGASGRCVSVAIRPIETEAEAVGSDTRLATA